MLFYCKDQFHKNAASNSKQFLEATHYKAAAVWPLTTHHENMDDREG